MVFSDSRQVIKAPKVLVQELGGEAVLLNLGNDQYYGLDENSFEMYRVLTSSPSVQAACETLLQEYEIDSAQLQLDLDQFLAHLLENDLVVYVNGKLA